MGWHGEQPDLHIDLLVGSRWCVASERRPARMVRSTVVRPCPVSLTAAGGYTTAMRIVVDADACPVKEQIYRVAARYTLPVLIVANAPMRVPSGADVEFVHVPGGLDAVDDW